MLTSRHKDRIIVIGQYEITYVRESIYLLELSLSLTKT